MRGKSYKQLITILKISGLTALLALQPTLVYTSTMDLTESTNGYSSPNTTSVQSDDQSTSQTSQDPIDLKKTVPSSDEETVAASENTKAQTVSSSDSQTQPSETENIQKNERSTLPVTLAASETIDSWMPDKALQQDVATALKKTADIITKGDMASLGTLQLTTADVTDLTGLEYAVNLNSFIMNTTNNISDFSVLSGLHNLIYVRLCGSNVTNENFPELSDSVTLLDLMRANVDNAIFTKIIKMTGLEILEFEENMNITDISPLKVLPNLKQLRIQFCGVADFTVINEFPALIDLAAFGQNIGRLDPPNNIHISDLNYDGSNETLFIPFSLMPNRLTNFDGEIAPFSMSSSASNTYLDFNGVQVDNNRLSITEEGITIANVNQAEFDDLLTFEYNARMDYPSGSYNIPEGFAFYSIGSGTYLQDFNVSHAAVAGNVTVNYVDENGQELHAPQTISGYVGDLYNTNTPEYQLSISGYTLDSTKLPNNAAGTLREAEQTVTYVYLKDSVKAADVTVNYVDGNGQELHPPQIIGGNVGEAYDTSTPDYQLAIDGYTLDETKLPSNMTGVFTDQQQTIIYVYTKRQGKTDIPVPTLDNKNQENQTPVKVQYTNNDQLSKTNKQPSEANEQLPQTNEQLGNPLLTGIGVGLLFTAVYLLRKRKQA